MTFSKKSLNRYLIILLMIIVLSLLGWLIYLFIKDLDQIKIYYGVKKELSKMECVIPSDYNNNVQLDVIATGTYPQDVEDQILSNDIWTFKAQTGAYLDSFEINNRQFLVFSSYNDSNECELNAILVYRTYTEKDFVKEDDNTVYSVPGVMLNQESFTWDQRKTLLSTNTQYVYYVFDNFIADQTKLDNFCEGNNEVHTKLYCLLNTFKNSNLRFTDSIFINPSISIDYATDLYNLEYYQNTLYE